MTEIIIKKRERKVQEVTYQEPLKQGRNFKRNCFDVKTWCGYDRSIVRKSFSV